MKAYTKKKEQLSNLKNKHKYNIVMIGDSLTARNDWNQVLNRNDILNMGQDGDLTYEKIGNERYGVLSRLDGLNNSYNQAFLMIGVNDIVNAKTVDEIFSNYVKIISLVVDNQIRPIIQSTLYITHNNYNINVKKTNKEIEKLNQLLYNYAQAEGILYIDLNKRLSIHNQLISKYTYDGVHINQLGYEIWATTIKEYLRDAK